MIKTKEFFALLQLMLVPGEMLQREVVFEKVLDDRLCKDGNCLFEISIESSVFCSIVCKTNDLCRGFFFNNIRKRCTGSNATLMYRGTFGTSAGSSFYQEGSNENITLSAEFHTNVQTTVLSKPSIENDSQNKMEPSTSQTSTSWKTSQSQSFGKTSILSSEQMTTSGQPFVYDLWTTRNTSDYSLVFSLPFNDAAIKCRILSPDSSVVRIEDYEENEFLQKLLIEKDLNAAFIGYRVNTNPMRLEYFEDGYPAEYVDPWMKDRCQDSSCVVLNRKGQWQCGICEAILTTICKKSNL